MSTICPQRQHKNQHKRHTLATQAIACTRCQQRGHTRNDCPLEHGDGVMPCQPSSSSCFGTAERTAIDKDQAQHFTHARGAVSNEMHASTSLTPLQHPSSSSRMVSMAQPIALPAQAPYRAQHRQRSTTTPHRSQDRPRGPQWIPTADSKPGFQRFFSVPAPPEVQPLIAAIREETLREEAERRSQEKEALRIQTEKRERESHEADMERVIQKLEEIKVRQDAQRQRKMEKKRLWLAKLKERKRALLHPALLPSSDDSDSSEEANQSRDVYGVGLQTEAGPSDSRPAPFSTIGAPRKGDPKLWSGMSAKANYMYVAPDVASTYQDNVQQAWSRDQDRTEALRAATGHGAPMQLRPVSPTRPMQPKRHNSPHSSRQVSMRMPTVSRCESVDGSPPSPTSPLCSHELSPRSRLNDQTIRKDRRASHPGSSGYAKRQSVKVHHSTLASPLSRMARVQTTVNQTAPADQGFYNDSMLASVSVSWDDPIPVGAKASWGSLRIGQIRPAAQVVNPNYSDESAYRSDLVQLNADGVRQKHPILAGLPASLPARPPVRRSYNEAITTGTHEANQTHATGHRAATTAVSSRSPARMSPDLPLTNPSSPLFVAAPPSCYLKSEQQWCIQNESAAVPLPSAVSLPLSAVGPQRPEPLSSPKHSGRRSNRFKKAGDLPQEVQGPSTAAIAALPTVTTASAAPWTLRKRLVDVNAVDPATQICKSGELATDATTGWSEPHAMSDLAKDAPNSQVPASSNRQSKDKERALDRTESQEPDSSISSYTTAPRAMSTSPENTAHRLAEDESHRSADVLVTVGNPLTTMMTMVHEPGPLATTAQWDEDWVPAAAAAKENIGSATDSMKGIDGRSRGRGRGRGCGRGRGRGRGGTLARSQGGCPERGNARVTNLVGEGTTLSSPKMKDTS